nr:chromosome segregation protein SMC [Paracoccus sp. (in: a-proteobacteria)]
THDDPEQALDAVLARIGAAQAAHKARDELARKQRNLKDTLDGLETGRRALDAEARIFCTRLSAADLEAARAALLRLGRRDELRARAATLAARIRSDLNCADMESAAALLQDADPETTGTELARAEAALALAQARLGEAQREMFAADHALAAVGADDRVAMIEARRRALALAIEEGARDWLRRRAGIMAADHALRHYRDIHRSGMLARASEAFAAMTGGAYAGLATQPAAAGAGEVLIAQGTDGTTRDTAALSKGTRFQLYLALRIGGFHEYAAAHGAVPIMADDVLETFDDDRTARALAALSDTARTGQVIYLTHHRHVVELARAACPAARLHQL